MEFLQCSDTKADLSKIDNQLWMAIIYIGLSTYFLVFVGMSLWSEYRRKPTLQIIYILIGRAKHCGSLGDAPSQPMMDDLSDNLLSRPMFPDALSFQIQWMANQIRALGCLQMTLTFLSPLLGCLPEGDNVGHVLQGVMTVIAYSNIPYLLKDMKGINEVFQQHVEGHLSGSMGGCIAKRVACCFCKSKRLVKFVLKLLSLPTFINGVTTGLVMKASFDMMLELHSNAIDAFNSMELLPLLWTFRLYFSLLLLLQSDESAHLHDAASFAIAAQNPCSGAGLDLPRKVFTSVAKMTGAEDLALLATRWIGLNLDLGVLIQKMMIVNESALFGGDEAKRKKVLLAILIGFASLAGNASIITDTMSIVRTRTMLFQSLRSCVGITIWMLLLLAVYGAWTFFFSFNVWLSCTDDFSKLAQAFREVPVEMLTTMGVPIGVIAALSYFG